MDDTPPMENKPQGLRHLFSPRISALFPLMLIVCFVSVYALLPLVNSIYLPVYISEITSRNMFIVLGLLLVLGLGRTLLGWGLDHPALPKPVPDYWQRHMADGSLLTGVLILAGLLVVVLDLCTWFTSAALSSRTANGFALLGCLATSVVGLVYLLGWALGLPGLPGSRWVARLIQVYASSPGVLLGLSILVTAVVIGTWFFIPVLYYSRLFSWLLPVIMGFVHWSARRRSGEDAATARNRVLILLIPPMLALLGLYIVAALSDGVALPRLGEQQWFYFLFYGIIFLHIIFLTKPYGPAAVIVFTVLLFVGEVVWMWEHGKTDESIIAGLLPFSDAYGYFYGAQLALSQANNEQVGEFIGRRPIFMAFLSGLWVMTDYSLPWIQLIFAALQGVFIGLFVREVKRTHGSLAALTSLVLLVGFITRFTGTMLTEQLGLLFGLIATALLWRAAHTDAPLLAGLGVMSMGFALTVRAGAFTVLPFLLLWGLWVYRRNRKDMAVFAIIALLGIGCAFGLDALMRAVFVGGENIRYGGNYSYTLYGLAYGNKGWTYVYQNDPAIFQLPTSQVNDAIYSAAFQQIQQHPTVLLQGMLASLSDYFFTLPSGIFSFMYQYNAGYWLIQTLYACTAVALVSAVWRWWHPPHTLLILVLLGLIAATPLVPPIDADGMRVYAATVPFVALLAGIGATALLQAIQVLPAYAPSTAGNGRELVMVFGGLLLIVSLLPLITRALAPAPLPNNIACEGEQVAFRGSINPLNFVYIGATPASTPQSLVKLTKSAFDELATDRLSGYPDLVAFYSDLPVSIYMTNIANLADLDAPKPVILLVEGSERLAEATQTPAFCADFVTQIVGYEVLLLRQSQS